MEPATRPKADAKRLTDLGRMPANSTGYVSSDDEAYEIQVAGNKTALVQPFTLITRAKDLPGSRPMAPKQPPRPPDQEEVSWKVVILVYAIVSICCLYVGGLYYGTKAWAVRSEEELLQASVLHPLFNTEEHFAPEYWQASMQQKDRLEALTTATHATAQALQSVGVPAFLESAGLIGWLRHNRSQLPWDSDGDLGILEADCIQAGASKESLSKAVGEDFVVLKFACTCEEDCAGDNKRMVGRVAHRTTGVCIDIFAYAPVKKSRAWQKEQRYSDIEWWERVNDHADFTFPKDSLLPLQQDTFAGAPMTIPAKPREFLSWEYGQCLGAHVWPWRILLYSPSSDTLAFILAAKGAVFMLGGAGMDALPATMVIFCSAAAVTFLRGGLTLLAVLGICACEFLVVSIRPALCSFRKLHSALIVLAVAVCAQGLQGCLEQLLCQVDDFYLHPRRPKSWTLCVLGKCWDF
ncbi:hypothetical protein AK812_SmicGene23500 [Symbiodinium microadriaticum]|uniref:Uncharacterized protein n=1 Tax=Symbiodinium microadriaticum TaxID=2951 RepID=A0A1Q9DH41_SYMMI|nr:hypothetical protein AK812_SmicGene23500 [Symbiodinium microadriaticum]